MALLGRHAPDCHDPKVVKFGADPPRSRMGSGVWHPPRWLLQLAQMVDPPCWPSPRAPVERSLLPPPRPAPLSDFLSGRQVPGLGHSIVIAEATERRLCALCVVHIRISVGAS
eukprot:2977844-Amphidinium_carterae.1